MKSFAGRKRAPNFGSRSVVIDGISARRRGIHARMRAVVIGTKALAKRGVEKPGCTEGRAARLPWF